MKTRRLLHAFIWAIFPYLLLVHAGLCAQERYSDTLSSQELRLLTSEIESATQQELLNRVNFLGITIPREDADLRNLLYTYYGIVPMQKITQTTITTDVISVTIHSADSFLRSGTNESFLILEGNVGLSLTTTSDDVTTKLYANRIIVDIEHKTVTGIGSVRYRTDQESFEDNLKAYMITFDWSSGHLLLSKGVSSMTRENSEKEEVEFFVSGEQMFVSSSPWSIGFENGLITTHPDQAYFSIRAKELYLVDGGDFFVKHAVISLGRVPLLWFPFMYYPGKTFIFNPAIGISSEKGAFFSSSTELYGRYPKILKDSESSFSTLLSSNPQSTFVKDGWVYSQTPSSEISPIESWAERTQSYFSILFDAYQQHGVFLGIDTVNKFDANRYVLSGLGGFGFAGLQHSSWSSIYQIPEIRYFFEGNLAIDTSSVDLSLSIPFYSDPKVLQHYGNRLTSFSLERLFGNAQFPSTYQSDITQFTWELSSRMDIPTTWAFPFIRTLKVDNLASKITWKAIKIPDGTGYEMSSLIVPEFNATIAGTLFSWSQTGEDTAQEELQEFSVPESAFSFPEWGITSPYRGTQPAATQILHSQTSTVSLDYSLRHYIIHTDTLNTGTVNESTQYERLNGSFTLSGKIAPSLLSFSQRISPAFSKNSIEIRDTQQVTVTSTTDVSVPFIGLSYGLTTRIFNETIVDETGLAPTVKGGWGQWDADSVIRHQLSWMRVITTSFGSITPSLTAALAPLPYGFTPQIAVKSGNLSSTASLRIEEDESGKFIGKQTKLSISYSNRDIVTFSSVFTYDLQEYIVGNSWLNPLEMKQSLSTQLFDSYVHIRQESSYSWDQNYVHLISLSLAVPWASLSIEGDGPVDAIRANILDAEIKINTFTHAWWKNRIKLSMDLSSAYRHAFQQSYASKLTFGLHLGFTIEEFLTLDIALQTVNNGIHRYSDIGDVWDDLLRSFDFFGDGRNQTQFSMDSVSVSVIHHMADWDLHCKYEGSVVLSDMEWHWRPVFSVFLQWKAIPEIKVDREFDIQ